MNQDDGISDAEAETKRTVVSTVWVDVFGLHLQVRGDAR
jgi:hypothetical protein